MDDVGHPHRGLSIALWEERRVHVEGLRRRGMPQPPSDRAGIATISDELGGTKWRVASLNEIVSMPSLLQIAARA